MDKSTVAAAAAGAPPLTLLMAMQASILHKQVAVELVNGLVIVGRMIAFDSETMNVRLDSITRTVWRRQLTGHDQGADVVENPPQLPLMHSVALRGNFVKFVDLVDSRGVESVLPSLLSVVAKQQKSGELFGTS